MSVEFIAEIGSNWRNGSLAKSKKRLFNLIDSAAHHGANAVKLQLFKADLLYRDTNKAKQVKEFELPIKWLPEIVEFCNKVGVEFLCTPFYPDVVDILNEYVSRWKVSSSDITYVPLLEKIRDTGKPVLLSTGFSTMDEVEAAIEVLAPDTNIVPEHITLLHCTGGYPTVIEEVNLKRILDLAETFFPLKVGFSVHTVLPHVVAASILYGVEVIEVHYDLADKEGVETLHSFTPNQFETLVQMTMDISLAKDCRCEMTLGDTIQRTSARRDPGDWLRPVLPHDTQS